MDLVDERLNSIPKEKIETLKKIVENSEGIPGTELIAYFLNQTAIANKNGITFSDEETDIIIDVLKSKMTREQIRKVDLIKRLSKMMLKEQRS